jgi:hypothetical protein
MASYGTKGWVEFGLGADGYVDRLSLCWREDSLAAVCASGVSLSSSAMAEGWRVSLGKD